MSLAFATAAVHGQDLPTYQSTVAGQSPYYYNNLDNSLAPSVGTGTLVPPPAALASAAITMATPMMQPFYEHHRSTFHCCWKQYHCQ